MSVPSGSVLDISRGTRVLLDRSSLLTVNRMSYLDLDCIQRQPTWSTIITGDGELWMISTGYPVKPGETAYIGGFVDSDVGDAETSVPAGTIKGIRMGAKLPPGAGTVTYTLMKNGVPTGCAFQVGGATRKGKSLVEIQCADEDEICVEVHVSPDSEAEVVHKGTIVFVPSA